MRQLVKKRLQRTTAKARKAGASNHAAEVGPKEQGRSGSQRGISGADQDDVGSGGGRLDQRFPAGAENTEEEQPPS
jgi:hypothetical protein